MAIALLILVLVAAFGSAVMIGTFAALFRRMQDLESGPKGDRLGRLTAEIEALREEVEAANATVARLEERVDFTEKLLSPGPDRSGDDTTNL